MAIGNPDFLQTKRYPARTLRAMMMDTPLRSGVVSTNTASGQDQYSLMVIQRGAGANMSVDIYSGACWVVGTTSARQGAYHLYSDAATNLAIAANASGNPRVDQIIARIYDSVDGGAASDQGTLEVLAGTATAGAQIGNAGAAGYRAGAAALPANCVLLADVIVANGAASIVTANINDRRPWATGKLKYVLNGGQTRIRVPIDYARDTILRWTWEGVFYNASGAVQGVGLVPNDTDLAGVSVSNISHMSYAGKNGGTFFNPTSVDYSNPGGTAGLKIMQGLTAGNGAFTCSGEVFIPKPSTPGQSMMAGGANWRPYRSRTNWIPDVAAAYTADAQSMDFSGAMLTTQDPIDWMTFVTSGPAATVVVGGSISFERV